MKHLLYIGLIFLLGTQNMFAQNVGNEWINYTQSYYRVHVTEDGIHRIPYQQLVNSGFPADQIDPRRIQLFHKGEEQYIHIEGEGNIGIFDPNGYIEFYGERNRGYDDRILFDSPENYLNPDYSLFTDTAIYYITYNTSINNRRMAKRNSTDWASYIDNQSNYCIKQVRENYTASYYGASTRAVYTSSEGYLDNLTITDSNPRTKTISTPSASSTGPDAIIEIAAAGTPNQDMVSYVPHHLKVDFLGNTYIDEIYFGYEFVRKQINIPAESIPEQIGFVFTSNDIQSPTLNDYNKVAYIDIQYAHSFDFESAEQFEFVLPSGTADKDYLEITNFNTDGGVYLYDLDQHQRISCEISGTTIKALAENNGEMRNMILTNQNSHIIPEIIVPASDDGKFTNYMDIYPNPEYVIITHPSLMSSATEYQTYRTNTGLRTAIYDIEELYDQYAYGVKKHPYSMRNLVQDIINQSGRQPLFLFIIGKAINHPTIRTNETYFRNCLVPTFGNPPSDVLITAGMGDTQYEPLVATGRIAARNNQEVLDYLNKVIAHETNPVGEWMKNILHFGGGANVSEQTTYANYLANYAEIIEDTLYGGKVHTFLKNSSAPIQISTSDSVRSLINNGSSMMCFFGHASASGFDQSIDFPENYNNQDKYPFLLANSCYSGNIHLQYSESTSEDWVLIPDRGAIAFLAAVYHGFPSYLNSYSTSLYENISYRLYGESIGYQYQQSIKQIQGVNNVDVYMEATCHEMTLHGDPAIKLNHSDKPELIIENKDVWFEPENITTVQDSFQVFIQVRNIGKAFNDNFLIHLERQYPDNSTEIFTLSKQGSYYKDTIMFKVPVNSEKGPGLNRMTISLDYYDEIDELSEQNNILSINFLISTNSLFPIFPYEYAIYPNGNVNLKASTGNAFAEEMNYLFEMDTSDTFNSNLGTAMYSGNVISPGGIVEWTVPINLTENRVYYWRVAASHPNPDSIKWNESSFIYIPGEEGWSQAHFFQFKKDEYDFINYNRPERKFDYLETARQLQCHNQGILWTQTYEDVFWSIDGAIGDGNGDVGCCNTPPAMIVAVINPITLKGWMSDYENFGHRNYPKCFSQGSPGSFFVFSTGSADNFNEAAMSNMQDMIENHVPDDYYILAYSWADGYFESWSESLLTTFENLGATELRSVPNDMPYIFFCQKGHPETAEEVVGDNPNAEIDFYRNLYTPFNYGTILSTIIGPSNNWGSLHWFQETEDNPNFDITQLEIFAYNPTNLSTTALDTILPPFYEVPDLNEDFPADEYPYLKLNFRTQDDSVKTPGQLKKWQIRYSGVPETAINPQAGFYISKDTVMRGESLEFAIATENISTYPMDSLLMKYWLQTHTNEMINIQTKRLRPHPAGDVLIDTLQFETQQLTGLNSVWVEYNPTNQSGNYDQPEQYHFNNIAQYFFYVSGDNENPILDVTFDGVHILDGDIVSAKPEILITLNDENPYLALNDTSLFRLYLTNMNTGTEKRIYFKDSLGNDILEWTPGNLPENKFRIIYSPEFIEDGIYQLRVQATDASGNESGDYDYVIRFEVITKSSITNILNYPNPFSTSTRFVFELTGSVIPDEIRIEIYTVTGKLVKVIDQTDLGTIRVGRNITDYAWDGTDMYGDRLANGVYFYRVKSRILGDSIEHRSNESDSYFDKAIGKMYLMR
jgi:hypothetical protein